MTLPLQRNFSELASFQTVRSASKSLSPRKINQGPDAARADGSLGRVVSLSLCHWDLLYCAKRGVHHHGVSSALLPFPASPAPHRCRGTWRKPGLVPWLSTRRPCPFPEVHACALRMQLAQQVPSRCLVTKRHSRARQRNPNTYTFLKTQPRAGEDFVTQVSS